jgi:hypothetical protein
MLKIVWIKTVIEKELFDGIEENTDMSINTLKITLKFSSFLRKRSKKVLR